MGKPSFLTHRPRSEHMGGHTIAMGGEGGREPPRGSARCRALHGSSHRGGSSTRGRGGVAREQGHLQSRDPYAGGVEEQRRSHSPCTWRGNQRMGVRMLGQPKWGLEGVLGAHSKIGALVGALLEPHF